MTDFGWDVHTHNSKTFSQFSIFCRTFLKSSFCCISVIQAAGDVSEPESSPESEPIASFFISFAIPKLDAGLQLREEMMLAAVVMVKVSCNCEERKCSNFFMQSSSRQTRDLRI
mgnify:CR=1 FL=1